MPNYTKLFNSIVTSTIWTEDDKTRIVWITMLAISDKNGEVQASIPGLARVAGVSVDAAETAINKFLSPDAYSRTLDDEGRRIEKIDGGWQLLNHAKYRAMASKEDAKSANAERQQRHRNKVARNAKVTPSNAAVTQDRDIAEAEAEADTKKEEKTILTTKESKAKAAIEIYKLYPKKVGKDAAVKSIVSALSKIEASLLAEAVAAFAIAKKDSDPQFIPNPATWFNQCRWEDDRETWKPRTLGNFGVKKTDYGDRSGGKDRATQEQIDNFLM